MAAHSLFRTHRPILIGVFLLVAAGVVALSTNFLGHGGLEIDLQFLSPNAKTTCMDYYCSAVCPVGYYAIGGHCTTTDVKIPRWNLLGVLPSQQSWDCFLESYSGFPYTITAEATCLKVGDWQTQPYQFCGNFKIEPSDGTSGSINEVCDESNLAGYDCEDFMGSDGTPLCNGNLQCTSTCNAFDVSQCEYCSTQGCPAGEIMCWDGICSDDCSGHDGPAGGNGKKPGDDGGGSSCIPFVDCPGVPPSGGGPPFPSCGDGIVTGIEQCDPPGAPAGTCPGMCAPPICNGDCTCPAVSGQCGGDGTTAFCPNGVVEVGEQCENSNDCESGFGSPEIGFEYKCSKCLCSSVPSPGGMNCGNGSVDAGEQCDGGTSTCPPLTGQGNYWSCDSCQCVQIKLPVCGNDILEGDEECDGSTVSCPPMTGGTTICENCHCEVDEFFP